MGCSDGSGCTWQGCAPEALAQIAPVPVRARGLLGLVCLREGVAAPNMPAGLDELLKSILACTHLPLTLTSSVDWNGGPYQFPRGDTPYERRLDLCVLQRLGLGPGDTRPARHLFTYLAEVARDLKGIAVFDNPTENWPNWPAEAVAAYEQGIKTAWPLPQDEAAAAAMKVKSVAELEAADHLYLRPHHLGCILCKYGTGMNGPLSADNLWEPLQKMIANPDIPVTLVEGDCMVCPSCASFDPQSGSCVAACGLRDRLKDLDTFRFLGLLPGDTLPAREFLKLFRERIRDMGEICYYGDNQPYLWRSCGKNGGVNAAQGWIRLLAGDD